MKFEAWIKYQGREMKPWREEYSIADVTSDEEAEAWAKDTIGNFNASIRPGEDRREVVCAVIISTTAKNEHEWRKTNLVTLSGPNGIGYDTYKCRNCEATGKRFGRLSSVVKPDPEYMAKKWELCPAERTNTPNEYGEKPPQLTEGDSYGG